MVSIFRVLQKLSGFSKTNEVKGLHYRLVYFIIPLLLRGGAVWQLVGLITRRSQVQILPPLPLSVLGICIDYRKWARKNACFRSCNRNPLVGFTRTKGPVGPFVVSEGRKIKGQRMLASLQ